jgi:HEAT repeat protein
VGKLVVHRASLVSAYLAPGKWSAVDNFVDILTDEPARTPMEVFRRCEAAQALSRLGPAAHSAMPVILRTLVVPVTVDCVLALRVAAAEAVWKVGGRHDLALPFLTWALKDEYWGVSRQAAQVLGEMGSVAHDAVPDLVRLAERRYTQGRFHFEEFEQVTAAESEAGSLLGVVATSLGRCGRGVAHWREAHRVLTMLMVSQEEDARSAAERALNVLGAIGG